jgi:hypothetical protein
MTPNFKLHPSKFELLKLAELHRIQADTTKPLTTGQVDPATQQVTQQVRKLLAVCVGEAFEVISLRCGNRCGLAVSNFTLQPSNFYPALAGAFIEMTQPDSPTSPTQKYRLTAKGKSVLEGGV